MTSSEKALGTFRTKPWMHNCAQAVAAAFGREDLLEPLQACGGGNAPENTCGALWGAIQVAPEREAELREIFGRVNGATTCSALKRECRVPCQTCVKVACDILDGFQN